MKTNDFDKIFIVDYESLPRFKANKPAGWGNVASEDLTEISFKNLSKYFPECSKVSPEFKERVLRAMRLSFMRINEDGQTNCPIFSDFLICTMTITQEDIKNEFDKRLYLNLVKLNLSGEILLAS